ncbi:aminotransferase class V-fold PLP-dependent enzyme [Cytophagaceae bacterium ABcell3]|nr:aminotransferase class V-fold PLP-dependent enzyme [Cytophagaceae bacterium ABcell3]
MDHQQLSFVRTQLPSVIDYAFFNTGTAGPVPIPVAERMKGVLERQLLRGRITLDYYQETDRWKKEIRASLASMIKCSEDEIALTSSTTEGINLVINGMDWKSGDEIITSNVEHPAGYTPLFQARNRYGIHIKYLDLLGSKENWLEELEGLISTNTKLISLSHVSYCTGHITPLKEMCEIAHKHNIPVLVDGAQSFMSIPVDMKELGCDFYAAPGQKWLCGPEETGFLYVAKKHIDSLHAVYTGYGSFKELDMYGMDLHENAQRFEYGTVQPINIAGMLEACKWLEKIGVDDVLERIQVLNREAWEMLADTKGVNLVTREPGSGLIAFHFKDKAPGDVTEALLHKGVLVRPVPITDAVRISTGFYNNSDDLFKLTEALVEI